MENLATFVPDLRTDFNPRFYEQFFAQKLRHHYNLHQRKHDVPTTVFFVLWLQGKQIKISTGLKVYPRHWQSGRARTDNTVPYLERNNNRLLNDRLNTLDIRFEQYKRLVNEGVMEIDRNSLRQYITTGTMAKKQKEPIDVAKVLLQYLYKDTTIKDSTKENNVRFLRSFGEYLADKTLYDYEDITFEIMKGFQQWCVQNTKGRNGERASGESINKKVESVYKCIKKYLVDNRLMSGAHFSNIGIVALKETYIDDEIALRDDELTLLYNYKCDNKRDEEIKDLFLLECTTGQRFSDVEKVADLVAQQDGRTYFNLVQDKGGAKVQVDVIFQMALDILEKYQYKLPTHNKKVFNKRIKEIAKAAGIEGQEIVRYQQAEIAGVSTKTIERYNRVSSHTGRRTFITMLSLRGKTETEIARYSGHASLDMVRRYDKSKMGTEVKTRFERLKAERPELVLKMVGEGESEPTTSTVSTDMERLIIENYETSKQLEAERKQAEDIMTMTSLRLETENRTQTRIKRLMSEGYTEQEAIALLKDHNKQMVDMARSKYRKNIQKQDNTTENESR